MGDLIAKSPCAGLAPLTVGPFTLSEVDAGVMTSLAPNRGQEKAVSAALKDAHGMALPGPGRTTGKQGARAIWFARGHVMLMGPAPDPALTAHAALTDQSDAWAVVRLEGPGVEDVLARLAPVDLRPRTFKRGHTLRTDILHMTGSITRVGDRALQIMVFRSMAQTLVHDLKTAMEGVAARG